MSSAAHHAGGGQDGLRKAAILMVLLGEEPAGAIYRHLPEEELRLITEQIAQLQYVSPENALAILEEFQNLSVTQDYVAQGGREYAHKLLVTAFGEEGAQKLVEQVTASREAASARLDSLSQVDPQQLAKFLENEHPQTIALILAHLDPKPASELVMKFSEAVRAEVVKRLAKLRQFSPEVAGKVARLLHSRLESVGEQGRRVCAGVKTVADVLNRLDPPVTKSILEAVEREDAQLALSVRNLMFTFEDLISVPEQSMRELLGQLDKKTLALALRGGSEELKNFFFKAMSSRAVEMLKEDMEVLGPVRSKDVSKAQQDIVAAARTLEAEGKITLSVQEDEYIV